MEIIYLIIGVALGVIATYFYFLSRQNKIAESALSDHPLLADLRGQLVSTKQDLENERRDKQKLIASEATVRQQLDNAHDKLNQQNTELLAAKKELQLEFENLANRIFEAKSKNLTSQNDTELSKILSPFKERIQEFEQKVDKTYNDEKTERIRLKKEIEDLISLNKQLSADANNLATALKGDNKTQGNWGERVLESILERSGLTEGMEFVSQPTSTNAENERIRPDVVVNLPDGKHLIIDSKVSLLAYNSMMSAEDVESRDRFLKAHIESIKAHVKGLSDKNYPSAKDFISPDFVLLFMPIEAAFSVAVQSDQELYNYAWDRKIVLVSPTTLLATLRTVASIWQQEKRTRNAEEIALEAGKLYDKFKGFTDDLLALGNKMNQMKETYDDSMKKLTGGTGNLVSRTEKLRTLGAKVTKEIDKRLLERAGEIAPTTDENAG